MEQRGPGPGAPGLAVRGWGRAEAGECGRGAVFLQVIDDPGENSSILPATCAALIY